jgi:hypothetical protein
MPSKACASLFQPYFNPSQQVIKPFFHAYFSTKNQNLTNTAEGSHLPLQLTTLQKNRGDSIFLGFASVLWDKKPPYNQELY